MSVEPQVGLRFGRWLVLEDSGLKPKRWKCQCDCGTVCLVLGTNLRRFRSSGCKFCTKFSQGKAALKHGASESAEYKIWKGMLRRCRAPGCKAYPKYGGRGIFVCEHWQKFENFLSDMGLRPTAGHSVERIDNDGPYSPGNCRWATAKEQANNTCRNRIYTLNGETRTIGEWADYLGLPWTALYARIVIHGWTIERALTTDLAPRFRKGCDPHVAW